MWVYPTANTVSGDALWSHADASSDGIYVRANSQSGTSWKYAFRAKTSGSNNWEFTTTNYAVPEGQWSHIEIGRAHV